MNKKVSPEEHYKKMLKNMAKRGLHCPECGLWIPYAALKKGIHCPECGFYIELKGSRSHEEKVWNRNFRIAK